MLRVEHPQPLPRPVFEPKEVSSGRTPDLVCVSDLRWDSVFQRPQHLMTRFAKERRVFFIEAPVIGEAGSIPRIESRLDASGVRVVVPHLPDGLGAQASNELTVALIQEFVRACAIRDFVLWCYTPSALPWIRGFEGMEVIYDCLD